MNGFCILGVYTLSVLGGFLVAGLVLYVIRRNLETDKEAEFGDEAKLRGSFAWLDFWVGGTERAVATTLALWVPTYLPIFIGGWVTLKYAANWKRQPNEKKWVSTGSLIALIGSVVSFSVAIAAALLFRPDALQSLMK